MPVHGPTFPAVVQMHEFKLRLEMRRQAKQHTNTPTITRKYVRGDAMLTLTQFTAFRRKAKHAPMRNTPM